DLFRFSSENIPTTTSEFTNNTRDLMPGGTDYFSYLLDDIQLATGAYNGDGRQASHWKDSLLIGIMDPTLSSGEISLIGQNDLIAMDLIGWQIVPEPTTLCLLSLGSLTVIRRRRNR
ncbi:MAG: PEP-CTERM sorting domain-containing protein, partial [Desulfobulbaceae bacterium]|nr:PEP-CTERM sorting domain-containing protein [Desulfobulbaceae bacterium]